MYNVLLILFHINGDSCTCIYVEENWKKNTQRETVMCLVAEEGKVGNQSVRGLHWSPFWLPNLLKWEFPLNDE